jgi:glutathione transport system substrate-binding protein
MTSQRASSSTSAAPRRGDVSRPDTLSRTLKEPFSPFINSLAHPSGVIISPAALAQYGSKGIAQHPVGTGPFKFVEWKATDYLKVQKFDGYWRKGYPKIDSITWRPVVDNNTRAAVMQTNEAHFAFPMPPERSRRCRRSPASKSPWRRRSSTATCR